MSHDDDDEIAHITAPYDGFFNNRVATVSSPFAAVPLTRLFCAEPCSPVSARGATGTKQRAGSNASSSVYCLTTGPITSIGYLSQCWSRDFVSRSVNATIGETRQYDLEFDVRTL
jgi:hypothetical protein